MRGLRSTLALFLLLPLLAACAGPPPEPDPIWQGTEIDNVPSDQILWKSAVYSCHKLGFPMATGLDPSTMELTTAWRNDLQPFSGKGDRVQAHVVMSPLGRGRWRIQARIKKQLNQNLIEPLSLRRAEWEWTRDDAELAQVLVHHIRAYLAPGIEPRERPGDEVEALLKRAGLEDDGNDQ